MKNDWNLISIYSLGLMKTWSTLLSFRLRGEKPCISLLFAILIPPDAFEFTLKGWSNLQHKSLNFFDGWVNVNLYNNYLCITINKLVLYLLKLTDAKAASKCVVTIMVADAPIYHIFAPFLLQLHYTFPNSYITKFTLLCTLRC